MKSLRVAGIQKESIVDGEGYRYAIFTQGCNHQCKGCQNQETWDFNGGKLYSQLELEEVVKDIESNPMLDGITLSGGDPFYQADACAELIKSIKSKREDITVWAYTGFTWEELIKSPEMLNLAKLCDVIVDGRYIENKRKLELEFRGSSNQRLIDVKKTIAAGKVVQITYN